MGKEESHGNIEVAKELRYRIKFQCRSLPQKVRSALLYGFGDAAIPVVDVIDKLLQRWNGDLSL
jgi:hypothetical protein